MRYIHRIFALLLLAVYVTAVGGPVVHTYNCECIRHSFACHDANHQACHCLHCQHHHDENPAADALRTPDCCGLHESAIQLYVGPDDDDALRLLRIVLLPFHDGSELRWAALPQRCITGEYLIADQLLPDRACVPILGLRAPPTRV